MKDLWIITHVKSKKYLWDAGVMFLAKKCLMGVISIETFKKDYNLSLNETSSIGVELVKPQARKKYFVQRYLESEGLSNKSVPDFRYQLLWMPKVFVNESKSFSFFTSDVKGEFEIRIEGFSENGIPLSLRETIIIE